MPTNYPGLEILQASPCIRFNKEGILLAVSTNDNSVKILANADGIRLLRTMESRTFDASRVASAAVKVTPPPPKKKKKKQILFGYIF